MAKIFYFSYVKTKMSFFFSPLNQMCFLTVPSHENSSAVISVLLRNIFRTFNPNKMITE